MLKIRILGKLGQLGLDGFGVWQIAGGVIDFGVLHHACLIDDERGTLGDTTHDEVLLGEELVISCAIGCSGFVVVVGEKLQGDAFFLGPGRLCEGVVTGDAEDLAVQIGILAEAAGDGAELLGANTRKGHWHEEEKDVLLADLLGKLHDFRTTLTEGYERKIRGFVANLDAHIARNIGQERRWSSGKIPTISRDTSLGHEIDIFAEDRRGRGDTATVIHHVANLTARGDEDDVACALVLLKNNSESQVLAQQFGLMSGAIGTVVEFNKEH